MSRLEGKKLKNKPEIFQSSFPEETGIEDRISMSENGVIDDFPY